MNFSSARRLAGDGRLTHHTHNQKKIKFDFKIILKTFFFVCVAQESAVKTFKVETLATGVEAD